LQKDSAALEDTSACLSNRSYVTLHDLDCNETVYVTRRTIRSIVLE